MRKSAHRAIAIAMTIAATVNSHHPSDLAEDPEADGDGDEAPMRGARIAEAMMRRRSSTRAPMTAATSRHPASRSVCADGVESASAAIRPPIAPEEPQSRRARAR